MPDSPSTPMPDAAEPARGMRRLYGNKPFIFLMGLLGAGIFTVGWGSALMSYGGHTGAAFQVISWKVESADEATVTFQVNSSKPAVCVIRAVDAHHVEVGQARVEVKAGNRSVTTNVDTVRSASAVEVTSCREQASSE
ncbi:hypothetical protein HNR23_003523 [Nocardiopsis mwathae]|uniref:DUF4307 domain-containing protein n=1 Tax=Nocardiopsis mwathae TaxID=1472723 RepID=A0A7X0D6M2_9ACTN|nr:DUF4307 domain-containing protein [Nocardiopsis mwathae]MBB6173463.1 hypothetical protein [Nocardiopsis mwathae]